MKRVHYIIFLLLALLQLNCKKGIFGNEGRMITVTREAKPLVQIVLYDNVNLILTQDTIEKIKVEAPDKIESYITTEYSGQSLYIRNTNAGLLLNPDEKINVHVSVKTLNRFDYHGAGTVSCTNTLNRDYFVVVSSDGSGDVNLNINTTQTLAYLYSDMTDFIFSGKSDTCYTYCSSLGTIDYRNFNVKRLGIDYSGNRNAYVSVIEALHSRIFFKGDVYYKGNPYVVNVQTYNEGKLIHY